jgi:hypothetical protein
MSATPIDRASEAALPEIPGYKLLRVLGNGGMSTVYLGRQVSLGREVAIKVMLPEALADEVSRRRFENEARTIARLEHPHIVGIHEVGRTKDGLPYYAMPYLARGHLGQRDFTGDGPDDHKRVRGVLRGLLDALEYAHGRGVVHRDVKAENVLFDEAGRPLLADFGIALRKGYGPRVTTVGLAVGSTAYMAPEQARGEKSVDSRADLYSVGVLAWEMLTGKLPYMAGDALSMAVMHAQDPIPRLPRPLRHWQRFIDKSLAKSPGQRFRNAAQMRDALARVPERGSQPLLRAGERMLDRIGAFGRWPMGAWVVVLLVLASGMWLAARQWQQAGPDDFFRALAPGSGLPTPDAQPGQSVVDITDSLLRPLPESPAEHWVSAAEQQLQQHNLTSPSGNNAYDSLLAAWQADAAHPRLAASIGRLVDAFGDETDRRLDAGDDRGARDYLDRANRLATQTQQTDSAAMARLRTRIGKALSTRIDQAAAKYDRDAAMRAVDTAKALGLDAASVAALGKRAQAVPQAGDTLRDDPTGMRLVRAGGKLIAVAHNEVSRADYARFASATGRPASLCRERASLLRIVAPRSWKAPGFEQSPQQPVVCVSANDAEAYARWLAQRSGQHYRLPTGAEARALPASGGAKPVAQWLAECGANCSKRVAHGTSWRGQSGSRPLDANRGYDDVGFRLVRDP